MSSGSAPLRNELWERAEGVLKNNDAGGWTKAAPRLYPHQWSWDSAMIAVGWAHLDTRRAATELGRLLNAQWSSGKVPHIVFDPAVGARGYLADLERWSHRYSSQAPAPPPDTSGLCQPPLHAIAVERMTDIAAERDGADAANIEPFAKATYPRLFAWHRYLATARDPERSGLVTIYHPWESGMDNSPRWDGPLSRVDPMGDLPPYEREDVDHLGDASQRPSDTDYRRHISLLERAKRAGYDDVAMQRAHDFLVKDVVFSAILVAANEALLRLGTLAGADDEELALLAEWARRGRRALTERWDPGSNLCPDHDLRADEPIRTLTAAAFAPLIGGVDEQPLRETLLTLLDSTSFLGHPGLRWRVLPSTSPNEQATFDPRNYWRGPSWPVVDWLLWRSLLAAGEPDRADSLRAAGLERVAAGGFHEYFQPFTGEPLGSSDQSWTAAVTLDWLASDPPTVRGDAAVATSPGRPRPKGRSI